MTDHADKRYLRRHPRYLSLFSDWIMAACLIAFLSFIYGYVDGTIQIPKVEAKKEQQK